MSNPKFRWVRRNTYALKRRLGQPVLLRYTSNDATNFTTGEQVGDLTSVFVPNGVLMPAKDARLFQRIETDVARAQQYAYGAMFDARTRYLLIDQRDLPSDFPIDLNMHVVFPVTNTGAIIDGTSKRWEVKNLEEHEEQECLIFTLQSVDGAILDPTNPNPNPPQPIAPNSLFVILSSNTSLANSDTGKTFSNAGVASEIDVQLPDLFVLNTTYTFVVEASQVFKILAGVGQTIESGGSSGTSIQSQNPISSIQLVRSSATTWIVVYTTRVWSVQ